MNALEWAFDYETDETNRFEIKLRKAYVDSICEQAFGGKYVKSKKTGKREWENGLVPHRIIDVHKFATFMVPTNCNLGFNSTRQALTRAGDKLSDRREKNKIRAIQNQIAELSQKW